jgi:hypothetical protein
LREVPLFQIASILAGGSFTVAAAIAAGCLIAPRTSLPLAIRFTTGAALLSTDLFVLLALNAGYTSVFVALGLALIALALFRRPVAGIPVPELHPALTWFFRAILGTAVVFYFIYAIAPEIEPDAIGYHLGLVQGYLRTHSLSHHVSFYEILPQGVDLLYAPAFAIGSRSAPKLVHFAFLLSIVPLIRHMGKEMGVSAAAAATGGALLFLSPVAAIVGTSGYTDLALVASTVALCYLLARWQRESDSALLLLAGLNAGFSYAIKPTFGYVALAALGWVCFRSNARIKSSLVFAAGAAIPAFPWLLRASLMTGNPIAPMLNAWFPHDGLDASVDRDLLTYYSPFSTTFHWRSMLPDYTVSGGHEALLGPAFLLLPLALFAARTKPGRKLLAYSLFLTIPFFTNTGTRFLMPAAAPAAIAIASVLPVPAAAALVLIQAVGNLRPVTLALTSRYVRILPELPLRAALRIEPERDYVLRKVPAVWNDIVIHDSTPPGAKIFSFAPVVEGWLDRNALIFWQSAQGERIRSAMDQATYHSSPTKDLRRDATDLMIREGYPYVLVPTANDPFAPMGQDIVRDPARWRVRFLNSYRDVSLFQINPISR